MGKHNKLRQHRHQVLLPMVEIVDIRTGHNHLVTLDAAAAAWQAAGRYGRCAAPRSCPQRWSIPERATAGRAAQA